MSFSAGYGIRTRAQRWSAPGDVAGSTHAKSTVSRHFGKFTQPQNCRPELGPFFAVWSFIATLHLGMLEAHRQRLVA